MTIHMFGNDDEGFEVWTDCEPGHAYSGRCIGGGDTVEEAKREALQELQRDVAELEQLTEADVQLRL